ncbi:MAG: hypothetical protein AAF327_19305, partial [Cyanobacteria bacterium P01_A01_bin.37]
MSSRDGDCLSASFFDYAGASLQRVDRLARVEMSFLRGDRRYLKRHLQLYQWLILRTLSNSIRQNIWPFI